MKKSRKIAIFCSHYYPYLGGVENYTAHLAGELKKRGDRVVIVTSNDMHLQTLEWMEGIPVVRMPCFNLLAGRFPVSRPDGLFWRIHRRLKKISFDLVVIQTRFYPHSLYAAWLAKKQGSRCIVIDHGTSHMTVGSPFWDRLGAWYEHGITALLKRKADGFYGVSQACCRWLTHFRIQPAGVLYNGIDPREMEEMTAHPVRDFGRELGISSDTLVITYTGRLVKEKGVRALAEAFLNLPKEYSAVLCIAGDGEEMDWLEKTQDEKIFLLGRISLPEVASLLVRTDIYCLPTGYPEGFPTAVLEAAAAGCYIVTTDKGGSRELILDDSYGTVMEDNYPETIRQALMRAAADETERKEAAKKAKKRLLRCFTWDKTAGQVHDLAAGKHNGGEYEKTDYHSCF